VKRPIRRRADHDREAGASGRRARRSEVRRKLADLHDRGVITDAEFEREKQKILH
jgi:hypothetical protein